MLSPEGILRSVPFNGDPSRCRVVAVVGMGIVGVCTGYEVFRRAIESKQATEIMFIEQCERHAVGSSGKAAGFLAYYRKSEGWAAQLNCLLKPSFALHRDLAKHFGEQNVDYRRIESTQDMVIGTGFRKQDVKRLPTFLTLPPKGYIKSGSFEDMAQVNPVRLMECMLREMLSYAEHHSGQFGVRVACGRRLTRVTPYTPKEAAAISVSSGGSAASQQYNVTTVSTASFEAGLKPCMSCSAAPAPAVTIEPAPAPATETVRVHHVVMATAGFTDFRDALGVATVTVSSLKSNSVVLASPSPVALEDTVPVFVYAQKPWVSRTAPRNPHSSPFERVLLALPEWDADEDDAEEHTPQRRASIRAGADLPSHSDEDLERLETLLSGGGPFGGPDLCVRCGSHFSPVCAHFFPGCVPPAAAASVGGGDSLTAIAVPVAPETPSAVLAPTTTPVALASSRPVPDGKSISESSGQSISESSGQSTIESPGQAMASKRRASARHLGIYTKPKRARRRAVSVKTVKPEAVRSPPQTEGAANEPTIVNHAPASQREEQDVMLQQIISDMPVRTRGKKRLVQEMVQLSGLHATEDQIPASGAKRASQRGDKPALASPSKKRSRSPLKPRRKDTGPDVGAVPLVPRAVADFAALRELMELREINRSYMELYPRLWADEGHHFFAAMYCETKLLVRSPSHVLPDQHVQRAILKNVKQFAPCVAEYRTMRQQACVWAECYDLQPIIDEVMPGVHLAVGAHTWGVTCAPVMAAMVADAIFGHTNYRETGATRHWEGIDMQQYSVDDAVREEARGRLDTSANQSVYVTV